MTWKKSKERVKEELFYSCEEKHMLMPKGKIINSEKMTLKLYSFHIENYLHEKRRIAQR